MSIETIEIPEVNLMAHSEGGLTFAITEIDENEVQVDISALTIKFRTEEGALDIACIDDPLNELGLLLSLSEANIAAIGPAGTESKYALVLTSSAPDEVLAYGRIVIKGWGA